MFTGFTPETIDFLWGIRMNNNKEWFTANKKQYTDHLYHPMKELGKALFEPFLDKPGNVLKVDSQPGIGGVSNRRVCPFQPRKRILTDRYPGGKPGLLPFLVFVPGGKCFIRGFSVKLNAVILALKSSIFPAFQRFLFLPWHYFLIEKVYPSFSFSRMK